MTTTHKMTEFQRMLNDGYLEFIAKTGKRKASDNEYARWLGVSPPSLNQWINGYREPNLANALILSERLGPGILEVLGYPIVLSADDERLKYIVKHWHDVDDETRDIMKSHVEEVVQSNAKRREQQQGAVKAGA